MITQGWKGRSSVPSVASVFWWMQLLAAQCHALRGGISLGMSVSNRDCKCMMLAMKRELQEQNSVQRADLASSS